MYNKCSYDNLSVTFNSHSKKLFTLSKMQCKMSCECEQNEYFYLTVGLNLEALFQPE